MTCPFLEETIRSVLEQDYRPSVGGAVLEGNSCARGEQVVTSAGAEHGQRMNGDSLWRGVLVEVACRRLP